MAEARIRRATDDDLDAILTLMSASLGDALPRLPDFFRWKHFDNPFGRSFVLVAEDDEGLVGLRAMMRWRFVVGDEVIDAVRPVDTATHPRFRRRGLFTKLTYEVLGQLADAGVSLVFNTPNEKSRPGYLKMGWESVGKLPVWVRPGGRFAIRGASARGAVPEVLPPSIRDGRLHTAMSASYVDWRYDPVSRLEYGGASDGDVAAIFRTRERFGRSELTITNLFTSRASVPRCARLVRRVVRSGAENHALAMAAPNTREAAVLALAGFVPVPSGGPHLVMRRVDGRAVPIDPKLRGSWRLQVGDLEVF